MPSLDYEQIYSRFYSKAKAYEFFDLTKQQAEELLCNWLHSACAYPYVRKLFVSIELDDDSGELSFSIKDSVDKYSDEEFVIDILSHGVLWKWLDNKVATTTSIAQTYGTTKLKFYSERNHLEGVEGLYHQVESELRRKIADRGYVWNSYLGNTGKK